MTLWKNGDWRTKAMKTIDEVIENFEKVIRHDYVWFDEKTALMTIETLTDTLQYLKAYKEDRNDLTALRAFWAEQQANPALTWSELQQMEGKPVWICEDYGYCAWQIIDDVYDDEMYTSANDYDKKDMGKEWQAYRKER